MIVAIRKADEEQVHPAVYLPNNGIRKWGPETKELKDNLNGMSLNDLSEYADMVVVAMVHSLNKNKDDLELATKFGFFKGVTENDLDKVNSAGIGGFAYIVINSTNKKLVEVNKRNLELMCEYLEIDYPQ